MCKAYTLISLLLTICIVAILSGILFPRFVGNNVPTDPETSIAVTTSGQSMLTEYHRARHMKGLE